MITQEFNINIIPHGLPPRVPINQYDVGLRTLIAHVYQDDTEIPMTSAYTYTVVGTKPSGTGFVYTASVENGAVVIDVTAQMSVVAGPVRCGILIQNGEDVIGTLAFILDVQQAALTTGTIIDSDDFGTIITDAIVDWMDEHGVPIDSTLTNPDAAANAKVTGDAIAAVATDVAELTSALEEAIEDFAVPTQEAVDNWLDEHPEATTTVQDGSITKAKFSSDTLSWLKSGAIVNLADFANGSLTGANMNTALTAALNVSSRVYVPAGTYSKPSGTTGSMFIVRKDCEIFLDEGAEFSIENSYRLFDVEGCYFSLHGGTVHVGDDDFGEPNTESRRAVSDATMIRLTNVKGGIIEGLTCTHSKYFAVITLKDAQDVEIVNCRFTNFLMSAIHLSNHNENIRISGCWFENSYIPYSEPVDPGTVNRYEYCYFVYTGQDLNATGIVPPNNFIIENCYGYNSEDCGFDTHGATNVIFRNNKVLETVCALTAYNDNRRVLRPSGWTMHGIRIENNWCESSKTNWEGRTLPHPFIFLGSANFHSETESGYENNPGTYDAFMDCVVEGNYFKSPCKTPWNRGLIHTAYMSRNISIRNNTIDCMNSGAPATDFIRCINFEFSGNLVRNSADMTVLGSIGVAENNTLVDCLIVPSTEGFSYLKGSAGERRGTTDWPMLRVGDMNWSSGVKICTDRYGIRVRSSSDYANLRSYTVDVTNGIAYCADILNLIPGMAVKGIDSTYVCYIVDVINQNRFVVRFANGNIPNDVVGATMTIPDATMSTLTTA